MKQGRWKRGLSGLSVVALTAGAIVVGSAPAVLAAPATFNPFEVNEGFTIVSQGDTYLNNGELEGSIASFGSISSGNPNGYPMLHQAAGNADYTVPQIDGVPVRILADRFTGSGGFDVSNRDDSGTIAANSPEANAVVKLVATDGLTGSERGNFLRITNPNNGIVDLKTVPFAGADVNDYRTAQSSVAAYFPEFDARVAQTNQCLASMYDPELGLTNPVTVEDQGGMVYVENFAADRPNVIDYADVVGKTIKMDRANGYKPTADAPLVIRVAPGTTDLGQLRFEGWSAQAGAQQSLARYILLDLSAVSGDVRIDGLELGAIWAPNANLKFNSGVTTNGQWFAKTFSTAGGGEVHHHTFGGKLPCGDKPVDPVDPVDPKIGTTVAVDGSAAKVLPLAGGTVIDTVAYEGLTAGKTYVLSGEVRTAPAGEKTGITATASFTPASASGTTTVTFTITEDQVAAYAGQDLVVFEYLTLDGAPVAEHADAADQGQTFTVADEVPVVPGEPKIGTSVAVNGSATKVLPLTGGTVIDMVGYEGLTPGKTYSLAGEVRTAPAGVATGITAAAAFTPETAAGTTAVTFTITEDQVAAYAGQDLVVFEYLTLDGKAVAEHTDAADAAQTFTVADEVPVVPGEPKIGTAVSVYGSATKVLPLTGGTVIDMVSYEGLTPGKTYALAGEVRTAPAGVKTGITATTSFTPEYASGTTLVTFDITADQVVDYAGQDLVVFEYLTLDGEAVAEHTDAADAAQTFTVADAVGEGECSTGSGSIGGLGSLGSLGDDDCGLGTGSLGSLGGAGLLGSVALGSLGLGLGSIALGSLIDGGSLESGPTGSSEPGTPGTPALPGTPGTPGTSSPSAPGAETTPAAPGGESTDHGAVDTKGGRIDAGLGANSESSSSTPLIVGGLVLLAAAGALVYVAVRRRKTQEG